MLNQRAMWFAAAVVATLCGAGATTEIYRDFQTTHANVIAKTDATARLADVHADRALSFIRETFDHLTPFVVNLDHSDKAAVDDLRDRFQDMATASESIGTLWVTDASGHRWLNNVATEPPSSDAAEAKYFLAAKANPDSFIIGSVDIGKVMPRPRFTISRGLRDAHGQFLGVLTAGVDVDYFSRLYGSVRSGPNVQLVALNAQGQVLAVSPSAEPEVFDVAKAAIAAVPGGDFQSGGWNASVIKSQTFPIVLVAITNMNRALNHWRRRSWQVAGLSSLMLLGFALLTVAGIRSANREAATAGNLRLLNESLEQRVKDRTASIDLLLRELNHRVKNNLQIVGSLIRLQSRAERDPNVIAILEKTNQRIFAVADLHCELETADSGCASSKEFFERIIRRIVQVSEAPGRHIEVELHIDDVPLTVDRAVPLGLILTETVTNCFKHAFANRIRGLIEVTFRVDGGVAELTVRDDGAARSPAPASTGLGSRIVQMLARQIDGVVTTAETNGRRVRIIAPLADAPVVDGERLQRAAE